VPCEIREIVGEPGRQATPKSRLRLPWSSLRRSSCRRSAILINSLIVGWDGVQTRRLSLTRRKPARLSGSGHHSSHRGRAEVGALSVSLCMRINPSKGVNTTLAFFYHRARAGMRHSSTKVLASRLDPYQKRWSWLPRLGLASFRQWEVSRHRRGGVRKRRTGPIAKFAMKNSGP